MSDFDQILKQALAETEIISGADVELVKSRNPTITTISSDVVIEGKRNPPWSPEEIKFLTSNLGQMDETEIAKKLGRSRMAVKLYRYRGLNLPSIGKNPDYFNLNTMAGAFGVDRHTTMVWRNRGYFPTWRPKYQDLYMAHRRDVYRWAINPENWYIIMPVIRDPDRITDPKLKKFLLHQIERYGSDYWLTPGEVAGHYGVKNSTSVNQRRVRGDFECKRFGNWWYKKSSLIPKWLFQPKMGSGQTQNWSGLDKFISLAWAVGNTQHVIDRITERDQSRPGRHAHYRLSLVRKGKIETPDEVSYRSTDGAMWADWWNHQHRFPYLTRQINLFLHEAPCDLNIIAGILHRWAIWYELDARRFIKSYMTRWLKVENLRRLEESIRKEGYDPFRREVFVC